MVDHVSLSRPFDLEIVDQVGYMLVTKGGKELETLPE